MSSTKICLALAAATMFAPGIVSAAVFPAGYTFTEQFRANLLVNPQTSFNVPHGTTTNSTTVSMNNSNQVTIKLNTVGSSASTVGIFAGPGNGTGGVVATANSDDVFWSDSVIGDSGRILVPQSLSSLDGIYSRDTNQPVGVSFLAQPGLSYSGLRLLGDGTIGGRSSLGGQTQIFRYNPTTAIRSVYVSQATGGFSFIASPFMTDAGKSAARVFNDTQPSTSNDQVRLFNSDGSSTLIFSEGQSVPGMAGTITSFGNSLSANASGWVTAVATVGGKSAVLLGNGTDIRVIANVDSPLVSVVDAFAPVVNASGLVAFRGREEDGDDAIFVGDGLGNLLRVIGEGDVVASDFGPAQLGQETASPPTFSGGLAFNDAGNLAFTTGLYPQGDRSIELGTAVFVAYAVIPEPAGLALLAPAGILLFRRR